MPVKIDPDVVAQLAAMDLVIWEAKHPKQPFFNEKTGKQSQREDKSWVLVTVAGPGADNAHGGGRSLQEAVDRALTHSGLADRAPGLRGASLRLEKALFDLWLQMRENAYKEDPDGSIPF